MVFTALQLDGLSQSHPRHPGPAAGRDPDRSALAPGGGGGRRDAAGAGGGAPLRAAINRMKEKEPVSSNTKQFTLRVQYYVQNRMGGQVQAFVTQPFRPRWGNFESLNSIELNSSNETCLMCKANE